MIDCKTAGAAVLAHTDGDGANSALASGVEAVKDNWLTFDGRIVGTLTCFVVLHNIVRPHALRLRRDFGTSLRKMLL